MDADRFDTLARSLGAPTSRRTAFSAAVAGGLLSALGLTRAVPEARAAQGGTCVVAFTAQVVQGPSTTQTLIPNAARPGEVRGDLSFSLSATGNLENATLALVDGTTLPVVGQATGHALQVRIELAPRVAVVAIGVGEQEIARCQGAIDGVASGPDIGDLGDWHAAAVQQAGGGGQGTNDDQTQEGRNTSGNRADRAGRDATQTQSQGTVRNSGGASSPPATGSNASQTGGTSLTCDEGFVSCDREDGYCADLLTDSLNCGACGNRCVLSDELCQNGVCIIDPTESVEGCLPGLRRCGDVCVDFATDADNCGSCGNVCPYTPEIYSCEGGVCIAPTCDPLLKCGLLCVDPLTDPLACGGCGIACTEGTVCQDGSCIAAGGGGCLVGLTMCIGVCVDVSSDPFNCGGCGLTCVDGTVCDAGACITAGGGGCLAGSGLTYCNGTCVDLNSDTANCGACGVVCETGFTCQVGGCIGTVP